MESHVYKARRERLMAAMAEIAPRGIAILPGASLTVRNSTVHHEFRQCSDFAYFTGFEEPDAALVLTPNGSEARYTLFVPPRDPEREIWDGPRAGVDGAVEAFDADAAFPIADLEKELPRLFDGTDCLFYTPGLSVQRDALVFGMMRRHWSKPRDLFEGPEMLYHLAGLTAQQRWHKSPEELDSLRRAARVSALAHREAMRLTAPGLHEYQLQAVLEFCFKAHGSHRPGYGTIVASGSNATTLHHVSNRRQILAGDLVLVDAGCEVDLLTADITRTFPATGRFSGPQRALYEVVLAAQVAAIEASVVGQTAQGVHDIAVTKLTQGMVALELLSGQVDELIATEKYKRYYPHRTGHWLGMDVHDVGRYVQAGRPRSFEPGVAMTVEPGLYVREDDLEAPEVFRGLGVRIEDDIVITEGGPVVLTHGAPKNIDDVEALCRERSRFAPLLPLPPVS